MSRPIEYSGSGPDDATFVGAATRDHGETVVGLQLLGARFSLTAQLARELAQALVDVADAIERPGGLYGLPVVAADAADRETVSRAVRGARRRVS